MLKWGLGSTCIFSRIKYHQRRIFLFLQLVYLFLASHSHKPINPMQRKGYLPVEEHALRWHADQSWLLPENRLGDYIKGIRLAQVLRKGRWLLWGLDSTRHWYSRNTNLFLGTLILGAFNSRSNFCCLFFMWVFCFTAHHMTAIGCGCVLGLHWFSASVSVWAARFFPQE